MACKNRPCGRFYAFYYALFNAFIELCKELIKILTVNCDRLCDGLTVRHCATEAVHSRAEKDLRRIGIKLQALCDQRILRDLCLSRIPPLFLQVLYHSKRKKANLLHPITGRSANR